MVKCDLMDADQTLICKALGSLETYQSVLNCQKKRQTYFPVSGDHIQLLHDGSCHWLLAFSSSGRVQVCDNLRTNLTSVSKQCLKSFYQPLLKNGKLEVTLLPVEKETDGFNCGLFALAYASILFDGKSPTDFRFLVKEMRTHYIKCLKDVTLHPLRTLLHRATKLKTSQISAFKGEFSVIFFKVFHILYLFWFKFVTLFRTDFNTYITISTAINYFIC